MENSDHIEQAKRKELYRRFVLGTLEKRPIRGRWSELPKLLIQSLILLHPRVDPTGEYVAWTHGGTVAIKHVRESAFAAPTFIREPTSLMFFCDWTEHGDLLVNLGYSRDSTCLAVYSRRGQLLRRLSTPVHPDLGVVASWRKYDHR